MKGIFEFEFEGKQRGFYFNFNALGILEEMVDKPIDEIIEQINSKKPKLKLLSNFFYAGAVNYCEYKGFEKDFTVHQIGDWLSTIGLEKAGKLLREAISIQAPKNLSPLQTAEGVKLNGEQVSI